MVSFSEICRSCLGFVRARDAATAIEYALMAAAIALAIVAIVFAVGGDVLGLFEDVQSELASTPP